MNKKIIIGVIGALVVVMLAALAFGVKTAGAKGKEENTQQTLTVEKMDLESNIYTNGTVTTDEARKINYDGTGVVEKVFVKEGEIVKKGQVLAKLKSDQLENNIQLKKIQIEIEKSKLDQMVKEGDQSLSIALENAKLQMEEAKRNYESNKALWEARAISNTEFEKFKTAFEQAQNNFNEADFKLKNSSNQSNIAIQRKTIETANLELKQLEKDLGKTTIKSSIDGTVTQINLKEGVAFKREDYMFYVQNFKKNEIVANISEADINKVKVEQKVKITGNSITGKTLFGKVIRIAPGTKNIAGKKQAYVEIRIALDEYIPDLRTGFSVNLVLNTASKKNVKAVKFEAISSDIGGNKFVNVMNKDQSVRKVPVEIGVEGDVYVEIISDVVKVGDQLLMNEDYTKIQEETF
ncbi:HlyD family secretion protein [Crassaminicella profunda]|uniref:HlyD family secretion protein n=1 Tax=Crassaminicella profunda TaxID=1286698 RepID=UPI001CA71FEC|nr:efflux RND transporter periplasmic adaptor subunit [Crassaminicella profunda]QZY54926.1 efflux RND transporter periplasmic adaptor subunit [Crassaminicella profunda]